MVFIHNLTWDFGVERTAEWFTGLLELMSRQGYGVEVLVQDSAKASHVYLAPHGWRRSVLIEEGRNLDADKHRNFIFFRQV